MLVYYYLSKYILHQTVKNYDDKTLNLNNFSIIKLILHIAI